MKLRKYIIEFDSLINSEIEMVYDNNISMPYIKKPRFIHDFLMDVYNTVDFDKEYESNISQVQNPFEIASVLSKEENITVLTYCIRKDRFIEGFLMENSVNGLMSKLLKEYCEYHDEKNEESEMFK